MFGPAGARAVLAMKHGGVAQGQSRRLIIAESVVRVHPPLPARSRPLPGDASRHRPVGASLTTKRIIHHLGERQAASHPSSPFEVRAGRC
jgi:hypothetical protein